MQWERSCIIMIGGAWVRLPLRVLQDDSITKTGAAVLAAIIDRADGGEVELTAAEIAAAAGCCIRSVKTATAALERAGYISIKRTNGGASIYKQLCLPAKRRSTKRKQEPEQEQDFSKYDFVINQFPEVANGE